MSDADVLLRVVQPIYLPADRSFQSNAFQDQSLEIAHKFGLAGRCASVISKPIWEAQGGTIDDILREFPPGSAIADIGPTSGLRRLRTLGNPPADVPQGVMLDPRLNAPWHAVMFDINGVTRGKGAMRAIAARASWFHLPQVSQ
ncbi:MAG: hypothetical protein ACTHMS_24340 [Jatrophihabitans sp.]|uniref:hypothetical protein n=1 Tax=Jatrophihabitans sp. TaxID=1932789 RepID=UPI003F802919